MKSIISLAALASVALAQNAGIGLPTSGQTIAAGSDVIVQVQRPVSFVLSGIQVYSRERI